MITKEKIESFINSKRKFIKVLSVNGLTFEGEFGGTQEKTNGEMLFLKTFSGEKVGLYLETIRDIKFQDTK